jgi:protocatechuate 3,4-dioxygenase beta subunit
MHRMYNRPYLLLLFTLSIFISCARKTCPPKQLSSLMWIANPKSLGDKLLIAGTIYKADGKTPYKGIYVAGCHPDFSRYYTNSAEDNSVSRFSDNLLSGWCKTDSLGYFEIHSMRPLITNSNSATQQIHLSFLKSATDSAYSKQAFTLKTNSAVADNTPTTISAGETGAIDISKRSDGLWAGKKVLILK